MEGSRNLVVEEGGVAVEGLEVEEEDGGRPIQNLTCKSLICAGLPVSGDCGRCYRGR